jgi:8-oxo-dGTP diphosphatase
MIRLLDLTLSPDWPTMNRNFANALGVPRSDQDEVGTLLAEKVYLGTSWIPAPGASAALVRLTESGLAAAVVSNTVHGELAELLAKTGICGVGGDFVPVAAIIDSHTIGVEKPDPRPFHLALDALDESATNVVHVGDSLHSDVVGALGVGMAVVHVDPLNLCDDHQHEHSESFEEFVDDLLQRQKGSHESPRESFTVLNNFAERGRPLGAMLLIVTDDQRLILHHRDDVEGIAHPGCWAGFGGAVEEGESVDDALRREVMEETGLEVQSPIFLTEAVDYEGDGRLVSLFCVIGGISSSDIDLHEGLGVGVFSPSELKELNITPFVRRVIQSHVIPLIAGLDR